MTVYRVNVARTILRQITLHESRRLTERYHSTISLQQGGHSLGHLWSDKSRASKASWRWHSRATHLPRTVLIKKGGRHQQYLLMTVQSRSMRTSTYSPSKTKHEIHRIVVVQCTLIVEVSLGNKILCVWEPRLVTRHRPKYNMSILFARSLVGTTTRS